MVISYMYDFLKHKFSDCYNVCKGEHFLLLERVHYCGIRKNGDSSPSFNTGNNKQNAKANKF